MCPNDFCSFCELNAFSNVVDVGNWTAWHLFCSESGKTDISCQHRMRGCCWNGVAEQKMSTKQFGECYAHDVWMCHCIPKFLVKTKIKFYVFNTSNLRFSGNRFELRNGKCAGSTLSSDAYSLSVHVCNLIHNPPHTMMLSCVCVCVRSLRPLNTKPFFLVFEYACIRHFVNSHCNRSSFSTFLHEGSSI